LLNFMPGPDFPTGGQLVEDAETLRMAYETGRGSLRTRARWMREEQKHGTWVIVVTEIPYQVQKSRLIEQVAELLLDKKLPLLGDIRDESDEKIRLVLEPKWPHCSRQPRWKPGFR
jgi:topoisomerase-4 subunit A